MDPVFFENPHDFNLWLKRNHQQEKELLVGFYKVGSGKASMTWSQSVDEALCFGWIDGVRKNIDAISYSIRFTPRRPTSIWSAINIKKMEELTALNRVQPAGLTAFKHRKAKKSKIYSHENNAKRLPPNFLEIFKANKKAWDYFKVQAPSYRKVMVHWIMSAKQETTQLSRLHKTIAISETEQRMN